MQGQEGHFHEHSMDALNVIFRFDDDDDDAVSHADLDRYVKFQSFLESRMLWKLEEENNAPNCLICQRMAVEKFGVNIGNESNFYKYCSSQTYFSGIWLFP